MTEYRSQAQKLFEASFSSDRKRMSSVVRLSDGRCFVFMKGASEHILDICTHWTSYDADKVLVKDQNTHSIVEKTIQ